MSKNEEETIQNDKNYSKNKVCWQFECSDETFVRLAACLVFESEGSMNKPKF